MGRISILLLLLSSGNKIFLMATPQKWICQFTSLGHINPKRAVTIAVLRENWEVSANLFVNLSECVPQSNSDESSVYLHNLQPHHNQQPQFSQSQIVPAEELLGWSCKLGSTTCYHGHLPIIQTKRNTYFTFGDMFVIVHAPICNVIDINKAQIKLEYSNCKRGKTPTICTAMR